MKYFRKTESEYGNYIDKNGIRYIIEWCHGIFSAQYKTPDEMDYIQYESLEKALEDWQLEPYVDPTLEETKLNIIEND